MKKLMLVVLFLVLTVDYSLADEEQKTNLNLSLSSIRTEAETAAVGFFVEWAEEISVEKLITGDEWLTQISPEISVQTGDEDSFNGIIVKVKGYHAKFQQTMIGEIPAPDSSKFFSVFPFACGIETNRDFSLINALMEAGYVPFKKLDSKYFLGLNPAFGVFIQGGYKFEVDDENNFAGGAADESEEELDSLLFRTKIGGKAIIPIDLFRNKSRYGLSIIPEAWAWYDVVNYETYHRVVGILRISLDQDKHFDLKYENGSGAPNFNEGQQFSANITIAF
jgi:hypothetical protein